MSSLMNTRPRAAIRPTGPAATTVRMASTLALVTGVAWSAASILSLATPEPMRYLDVVMLVPVTLSLLGIRGIYALRRGRGGRLERIGYLMTQFGIPLAFLGQLCMITGVDELKAPLIAVGMLGWFGGLLLFGIGMAHAGVLPRWAGVTLALSELLTVLAGLALTPISPLSNSGDYSGAIAHGVIWLCVGRTIRQMDAAVDPGTAAD